MVIRAKRAKLILTVKKTFLVLIKTLQIFSTVIFLLYVLLSKDSFEDMKSFLRGKKSFENSKNKNCILAWVVLNFWWKFKMFENHRYVRLFMVILKHCVLLSSQTSDPPQNDKKEQSIKTKQFVLEKLVIVRVKLNCSQKIRLYSL